MAEQKFFAAQEGKRRVLIGAMAPASNVEKVILDLSVRCAGLGGLQLSMNALHALTRVQLVQPGTQQSAG